MLNMFRSIFILFFCAFNPFLLNAPAFAQSLTYPYVKVQGRQLVADFSGNGNYQPYIIRGVGYSPTPIGRYSSDWGYYISQFNINPNQLPNNMFADPNILNRDFSLLEQMNANTVRIWQGNDTLECGVSTVTFENTFPSQAPAYGDNIYAWLQQNNYLDADGLAIANLNSSAVLDALQAEFMDPGEYNAVVSVLQRAQSSSKNCGRFPNMITSATLTTAAQYNLKVIAGFWVQPAGYFNCSADPCTYILNIYNGESNDPGLNAPFDLTNAYIRNDILTRFRDYVTAFKDRPEILFWAIGNENNLHLDPNNKAQVRAWYSLVDQMAAAAHQIEGANYHPVAVVNGDLGFIGDAADGADDLSLPHVDIWGTNTYRGRSFADYFIQFKALSAKPLWISEYGIDAWQSCNTTLTSSCDPNNPGPPGGFEDQADQALWDGGLWDEIAGNRDITIGATVMEYSDEWWKPDDWICTYYPYNTYAVPIGNASYCHWNHFYFGEGIGSSWPINGDPYSAPSPDNYANEAWWGLMAISNPSPQTQADTLSPRLAYTTLQGKFLDSVNNTALASYLILPLNNGTSLNSTGVSFSWNMGRGVSKYELLIGTASGRSDIYSYSGTATSVLATGIPLTGQTVYVQLGSYINGSWQINNYSFSTIINTITAIAGTGGTISPSGMLSVNYGASQTFTITPHTGYNIYQLLVDGKSVSLSGYSYTFNNVIAAHVISVIFTPITDGVTSLPANSQLNVESIQHAANQILAITASADAEGGTISPSDEVSVNAGADQTFTITPNAGYSIDQVLVDTAPVAVSGNTYTFNNVISAHTISVSFKSVVHAIISSAGPGGTIAPSGNVIVSEGSDQTFKITPNTGYSFDQILVDGKAVTQSSRNAYTFRAVTLPHKIKVSFKAITSHISVIAAAGGRISPSDDVAVSYGASQSFSITPDPGYAISTVFVDGTIMPVASNNTFTFTNVTRSHSIMVAFTLITYGITANAGKGGSITPSGDVSVMGGSDQVFKITPNTGYKIDQVIVDGKPVKLSSKNMYVFNDVMAQHAIKADFIVVKQRELVSKAL